MAKYTKESKEQDGKTVVRYKDGKKYVDGKDVPEPVRAALNDVPEGTILDELGDRFDPETETDESEDETPPTTPDGDDTDEDESDADEEEQAKPAQKPAEKPAPKPKATKSQTRRKAASDTEDGEDDPDDGMGFPRVNGKTVDLFDGKTPHTHVKNVAGFIVPLSRQSYDTRTEAEIIDRLKELGKL
jgi:hypothetical protein